MPVDANGVLNRRINELLFAVGRNRDRAIHDARRFTAIDELSSQGLLHYCAPLMRATDRPSPRLCREDPGAPQAYEARKRVGNGPASTAAASWSVPAPLWFAKAPRRRLRSNVL